MRHACEFGQHVIRDQTEQMRVPLRTRYPAIGCNAQVLLASFHNPNGHAHFAADLGGRHGAQERFVTESGAVVVLDRRRPGQVRGGRHSIQAERLAQRLHDFYGHARGLGNVLIGNQAQRAFVGVPAEFGKNRTLRFSGQS
uniref:Uncharacterized protein n=1 Tax=Pseudomonas aeruginosa TaxID=287 RepID=A0A3S5I4U1_PSEAI|nr:Hypothetical protein [Pseudomonas aeruginosa]